MKRKSEDSKKSKPSWTEEEDEALWKAVQEDQSARDADAEEEEDWDEIAKAVPGKTPVQCLKRYMIVSSKKASAAKASSTTSKEEDDDYDGEKTDDEDEDEDSDGQSSKKRKGSPKEGEGSGKWTHEEIELLKKLVEAYKDSKKLRVLFVSVEQERFFLTTFFHSCSSLERNLSKL